MLLKIYLLINLQNFTILLFRIRNFENFFHNKIMEYFILFQSWSINFTLSFPCLSSICLIWRFHSMKLIMMFKRGKIIWCPRTFFLKLFARESITERFRIERNYTFITPEIEFFYKCFRLLMRKFIIEIFIWCLVV